MAVYVAGVAGAGGSSDDGAGINFFVPKQGTDADLLELCARFAVRASELAQS